MIKFIKSFLNGFKESFNDFVNAFKFDEPLYEKNRVCRAVIENNKIKLLCGRDFFDFNGVEGFFYRQITINEKIVNCKGCKKQIEYYKSINDASFKN